jgi:hypothetical protein
MSSALWDAICRSISRRSPASDPVSMSSGRPGRVPSSAAATSSGLPRHCRYRVALLDRVRAATASMVSAS